MRVLGLVGSSRPLGNTELLVAEVARTAGRVAGDESGVRLLRLTDLELGYCTGCMACADPDENGACPLRDDMELLLEELARADALVWGVPTYTLLPPGPVKLVADRLIMALGRGAPGRHKPAVTLGVAGLPQWSELVLPLLNAVTMGLGFFVADSWITYGAGPGEVLLEPGNVARARAAGERLHRALTDHTLRPCFGAGRCPICGADCFQLSPRGVRCPICSAEGELRDGVPTFPESPAHRWEAAALEHHFVSWIQRSGPEYLEKRREIRRLLGPYRELGRWRVKPRHPGGDPGNEGPG
jgi:multimeric flavodoxin WrbA